MWALRNVSRFFLGVLLVCVQSSSTTGNILGRVMFPEEGMKPLSIGVLIGVSNFDFQELRSDQENFFFNNGTYASNSSNNTQIKSDCMDDFECNVSWKFAEVNQTGKYQYLQSNDECLANCTSGRLHWELVRGLRDGGDAVHAGGGAGWVMRLFQVHGGGLHWEFLRGLRYGGDAMHGGGVAG
jgi:hypothetical protein